MLYIGSLFAPDVSTAELRESALSYVEIANLPHTGFSVLALLLIAIATHGEGDSAKARSFLDRAIHLALDLRMNYRSFAHMEGDPFLCESWRRTYWGLYLTDCIIAGMDYSPRFW